MKDPLPIADNVDNCMHTATLPESADYLVEQFRKNLIQNKAFDDHIDAYAAVVQNAKIVKLSRIDSSSGWSGVPGVVGFQKLQVELAKEASAELQNTCKAGDTMDFNFAVGPNSEILRGYEKDGFTKQDEGQMDYLLNGFLAKNDIVISKGILYAADKDGKKINENGQDKRVSAETVTELFVNNGDENKEDFQAYVKAQGLPVEVAVYKLDFPETAAKKVVAEKQEQKEVPQEERVDLDNDSPTAP